MMRNDTHDDEIKSYHDSVSTNIWKLTLLVILEFLGAACLFMSAHHLYMHILGLESTTVTPETKFKVAVLFICDLCTCILAIIALSALLGSLINVC